MKIGRLLFLIAIVVAISTWYFVAQARDKDNQESSRNATTVTGCLAKGDEPNEFYLTADNGKRYEVRSDKVSLADHIGQRITVTGNAARESDEDEDRDEGRQKEASESSAGNLQVTNMQTVSTSCK